MSDVTYSRPWLLYLYAAYAVTIASVPFAIAVGSSEPAQYADVAILATFVALTGTVACFWGALSAKTDVERGRTPRYLGPIYFSTQFRVYDDFFLVREFDRLRIRTTIYWYDEALDVQYQRKFLQRHPFGGHVIVRLRDEQGERTLDVWSGQAKEIAAQIAEAKRLRLAKDTKPVGDGVRIEKERATSEVTYSRPWGAYALGTWLISAPCVALLLVLNAWLRLVDFPAAGILAFLGWIAPAAFFVPIIALVNGRAPIERGRSAIYSERQKQGRLAVYDEALVLRVWEGNRVRMEVVPTEEIVSVETPARVWPLVCHSVKIGIGEGRRRREVVWKTFDPRRLADAIDQAKTKRATSTVSASVDVNPVRRTAAT